jgi:hypothetical protein
MEFGRELIMDAVHDPRKGQDRTLYTSAEMLDQSRFTSGESPRETEAWHSTNKGHRDKRPSSPSASIFLLSPG